MTLVAGAAVITVGRVGPDWPAQEFRTWIARNAGLLAWNDAWYAGHALPGYSVLFPAFAKIFGAGLTGLGAATACTWSAGKLVASSRHVLTRRSAVGVNVGAMLVVVGDLIIGQVPFLLGLAAGLLALLAIRDRHSSLAMLLAAACSLSSPLAGLFLVFAGVAWLPDIGWRRTLPFVGAGLGSLIAVLVGGSSGTFPFDMYSLMGIGGFVVVALFLIPPGAPVLRRFVSVYGVAALILGTFPNAVGGNLARLGELVALPLGLWVFAVDGGRRWRVSWLRPALFVVSLAAALIWQIAPVTTAIARSVGDPSSNAHYYTGLLGFLSTQDATAGRLEIPFTREHWEAAYVAPHFPLARGWERQLDIKYDKVLYQPLTPAAYRAWLDASAINLLALPTAPLDYGGVAERSLLAHPPSYLFEVYRDTNWTVYRVRDAAPLLTGANASLSSVKIASFTVTFRTAGTATIKLHASNLWQTGTSTACLAPSSDGWLHLRATKPETVTVTAAVSANTMLGRASSACDNDVDG
jgi:hypothetical protein